jgi:hypothetical protein
MAEYLNLNVDVSSRKWGSPDRGPYEEGGQIYGRVLVVREDKKDITTHQIEAITAYFKKVFECLNMERVARFKGLKDASLQEEKGKLMGEHVSRVKFEEFWKEYKTEKISGGDASWKDKVSPYEVATNGAGGDFKHDDLEKGLGSSDLNNNSTPVS